MLVKQDTEGGINGQENIHSRANNQQVEGRRDPYQPGYSYRRSQPKDRHVCALALLINRCEFSILQLPRNYCSSERGCYSSLLEYKKSDIPLSVHW
jgi:hypothetical protein